VKRVDFEVHDDFFVLGEEICENPEEFGVGGCWCWFRVLVSVEIGHSQGNDIAQVQKIALAGIRCFAALRKLLKFGDAIICVVILGFKRI